MAGVVQPRRRHPVGLPLGDQPRLLPRLLGLAAKRLRHERPLAVAAKNSGRSCDCTPPAAVLGALAAMSVSDALRERHQDACSGWVRALGCLVLMELLRPWASHAPRRATFSVPSILRCAGLHDRGLAQEPLKLGARVERHVPTWPVARSGRMCSSKISSDTPHAAAAAARRSASAGTATSGGHEPFRGRVDPSAIRVQRARRRPDCCAPARHASPALACSPAPAISVSVVRAVGGAPVERTARLARGGR